MSKSKIVVLCGSSRFVDIMAVCAWIIERDEKAIAMGLHLLPGWYSKEDIPHHLAEHEGVAEQMDELHLRKIDMADEVFIVNYQDYIGESTSAEIDYARAAGKKRRWYSHDPIGAKVQDLITAARYRQEADYNIDPVHIGGKVIEFDQVNIEDLKKLRSEIKKKLQAATMRHPRHELKSVKIYKPE